MINIRAYANCDHAYFVWMADQPTGQSAGWITVALILSGASA
jgi:hypothetical protein